MLDTVSVADELVTEAAPLDPDTQQPVADFYNPLGGRVTTLLAKREIFFSGMKLTDAGGTVNWTSLLDEFTGSPAKPSTLWSAAKPPYLHMPHASVVGDLTGTGKDSVVTAYYTGSTSQGTSANQGTVLLSITGPDGTLQSPVQVDGGNLFNFHVRNGSDKSSNGLGPASTEAAGAEARTRLANAGSSSAANTACRRSGRSG